MSCTETPRRDTLKILLVGTITLEMSYRRALKDLQVCMFTMADMQTWVGKLWTIAFLPGLLS